MASSAASIAATVTSAPTIAMEPFAHSSSPTMVSVIFSARHGVHMTDAEMTAYLRENGYPEHVIRAGRKGLIERWSKFVGQVERGYKLGLEDYRNDLDLRGIISMLGMDQEVSELDKRFEALLTG